MLPMPLGRDAPEFARWVMDTCDKHLQNGSLTVNELKTFLPSHPFKDWLTKRGNLVKYDADGNGGFSYDELLVAAEDFFKQTAPALNSASASSQRAKAGLDLIKAGLERKLGEVKASTPPPKVVSKSPPVHSPGGGLMGSPQTLVKLKEDLDTELLEVS